MSEPRPGFEDLLDTISRVPKTAHDIVLAAEGEEEIVDALGTIRSIEVGLADVRKMGASEIEPGAAGHRFRFEQSQSAKRSYNTQGLLAKFMAASDRDLISTLRMLMEEDVVRVSWQYTNLKKAARKWGVSLTTAHDEIQDGDPNADIGEVWKHGYPKYVAVEPEEEGTL